MIVILCGASASGKTTLANYIVEHTDNFSKVVTYTTRPPREGEVNGIDYYFLTNEKFDELKNAGFFVEYAKYRDWQYGTGVNFDKNENKIVVLTPAGARAFLNNGELKDHVRVIYLDVDRRSRLIKLLSRGDDIEEAYRRNLSDVGMFDAFEREADYVLHNNKYRKPVGILASILMVYLSREGVEFCFKTNDEKEMEGEMLMDEKVILYSTGCPKCKVLKMKLEKAGLSYEINEDVDEMLKLGLLSAPALGVHGQIMDFNKAIEWLKGQGSVA